MTLIFSRTDVIKFLLNFPHCFFLFKFPLHKFENVACWMYWVLPYYPHLIHGATIPYLKMVKQKLIQWLQVLIVVTLLSGL